MSNPNLPELKDELSRNVQAIGRMINSKKPLSYDDLTALRDSLSMSAETVQTIRDMIFE
jgi:hypothetical protein